MITRIQDTFILSTEHLRILHLHNAHIWQFHHAAIINLKSHNIMTLVCNSQLIGIIIGVEEVTQEKHCATLLDGICHKVNSKTHIRLLAFWLKREQFPNDKKNMLSTLLWRNKFLHLVRKKDDANLVIILNGGKSQSGSHFCKQLPFRLLLSAKVQRARHIHQQHHCQFTLLLKDLHIRLPKTGSHIPVDVTNIITILIFPHLTECHTSTLEG